MRIPGRQPDTYKWRRVAGPAKSWVDGKDSDVNGSRTSGGSETYGGFAGHDRGENREDRVESEVAGMLAKNVAKVMTMRTSVLNRTVYLDSKGITLDVGFRKFGCICYHLLDSSAFRILLLSVIPPFINSINKNSRFVSITAKCICQKGEEEVSLEINVDHFDFSGLT